MSGHGFPGRMFVAASMRRVLSFGVCPAVSMLIRYSSGASSNPWAWFASKEAYRR